MSLNYNPESEKLRIKTFLASTPEALDRLVNNFINGPGGDLYRVLDIKFSLETPTHAVYSAMIIYVSLL